MTVIILSKSNNIHSDNVEEQLKKISVKVLRFNVDKLLIPNFYTLYRDKLYVENEEYISSDVRGVFVHHPTIDTPFTNTDDIDKQLWLSGWKNLIATLEDTFKNANWVNKPSKIFSSSSLSLQLGLAKSLGFQVPSFILTNSIEQLKKFEVANGDIILKSGPMLGGNITGHRVLANKVSANNLDASVLKNSPCFFQNYIDKEFELRVNVIGDSVFACQILSQNSDKSKTDWRNYDLANVPHYPYTLDAETQAKCIQIVKKLGLGFGAIDLIVSKNNKIYFLECNSQGHWLWIERLTGQQVTIELTKYLGK